MTITLVGSMSQIDLMKDVRRRLGELKHVVYIPEDVSFDDTIPKKRHQLNQLHLDKIIQSDAILVVNGPKNGMENYIGSAGFLEMGWAYALEKQTYILYEIPVQPNTVEINGMLPVVLSGNLSKLS